MKENILNPKNLNETSVPLSKEQLMQEIDVLSKGNETLRLMLEGLKLKKSKTEVTEFLKSIFK